MLNTSATTILTVPDRLSASFYAYTTTFFPVNNMAVAFWSRFFIHWVDGERGTAKQIWDRIL
jgi:hypothetical protein